MRVEIQPPLNGPRTEHSVSISTNYPPRNAVEIPLRGNLSSVNVVGLPNHHPRQTSVPTTRNVVPSHSRNTSEPFRCKSSFLEAFKPTISNANIVSILNQQQRYNSNVPVNHVRSSSVPYQQSNNNNINNKNAVHQRNGSDVNARTRVPLNVSNVNVNYYRAVPVNMVSAVQTIQCLNSASDGNNVSNVNIVQAMPQNMSSQHNAPVSNSNTTSAQSRTEVIVHSSHEPLQCVVPERTRTFTSTEAQTDDIENATAGREQRRRERRERRHQRRLNNANHRHAEIHVQTTERLPDLLDNTLPPPYSNTSGSQTAMLPSIQSQMIQSPPPPNIIVPPGTIVQSILPNRTVSSGLVPGTATIVPFHPQVVQGRVPLVQSAGPVPVPVPSPTGFRFPFPAGGFRRSRYSEEPPKSCCGILSWQPGSLRWFIALIALVAVCCVLVGTALGAMRPSGRDHLTVSLLMIGVGIILVTVSGVAWRLTSHDSSSCRSMMGLGSTESAEVCTRRFVPRLPPSYGRPHHPYAAMMYPEFQYRPPPPSYQASMQEYRLRLLLLDRGNTPQIHSGIQNAVSPPPTYRSHSGSFLRMPLSSTREASQSEYSCPPSYQSQTSSARPAIAMPNNSIIHSRGQSLNLPESNNGDAVVNVVNILTTNEEDIGLDNVALDSLKLKPENDINPLKMFLKGCSSDLDSNLVTIVQTGDQNPVIVTVSGGTNNDNCNTVQITEISNEMEILAHL